MKPKSRKILSLLVLSLILVLPLGTIIADDFRLANFTGAGHAPGCHNGVAPESATGYIVLLNTSTGISVEPNTVFTVSLQVFMFIEAIGDDVSAGFSSLRGNNGQFSFNATQEDAVAIDGTGNSTVLYFSVTAPSIDGSYTLVADAIDGSPDTADLNWTTGQLTINVVTAAPPTYEGLEVLIIAGCILAAALVMALVLYQRRK